MFKEDFVRNCLAFCQFRKFTDKSHHINYISSKSIEGVLLLMLINLLVLITHVIVTFTLKICHHFATKISDANSVVFMFVHISLKMFLCTFPTVFWYHYAIMDCRKIGHFFPLLRHCMCFQDIFMPTLLLSCQIHSHSQCSQKSNRLKKVRSLGKTTCLVHDLLCLWNCH